MYHIALTFLNDCAINLHSQHHSYSVILFRLRIHCIEANTTQHNIRTILFHSLRRLVNDIEVILYNYICSENAVNQNGNNDEQSIWPILHKQSKY